MTITTLSLQWKMVPRRLLFLLAAWILVSDGEAFLSTRPSPSFCLSSLARVSTSRSVGAPTSALHVLPSFDSSSLTMALEVFDGSDIVDPVVVSNVFWVSLRGKLLSFFIGQLLAIVVFAILSSLAAQQLTKAGEYVAKNVFKQEKTFKKFPDATASPSVTIGRPDIAKLLVCIAIDLVGDSSELIPFVGEVTDFVWAPIAGLILRSLYGSNIVFALEVAEEILPFTDILPLATICWVIDTFFVDSSLAQLLQLGRYRTRTDDPASSSTIIDIPSDKQRRLSSGDDQKR